jgi:hypothetical protein
VTLQGSGFLPDTSITISFHSTTTVVGHAVADHHGDFAATVAVPETSLGGIHHFVAVGIGPSGQLTRQMATVKVVGVPDTSALQRAALTGAAFAIPAATWCVLVGMGRWRRRRARVR